MTDKERQELEELRKYKAEMEAKHHIEEPKLEPIEKRVLDDYNKGIALIDIARRHALPVERVLHITGNSDLLTVSVIGDQVDPSEIGNQGTYNPGQTFNVPFTTN